MADLSDLKPVYLIFGPEQLLLDQGVNRLKKRLVDATDADLDFNLDMFDGENTEASQIIAAANTLPFMSERRLVIVRNADKMPADGLGELADYSADPNPDTILVLVATKMAKNLRIYKAIDKLKGVAEYKAPAKRDYPKTVVGMFAERGRKVGLEAAEVLVRAVGLDLQKLSVEIDKVIAFTGEETTLSRHDIEQVMSTTAPYVDLRLPRCGGRTGLSQRAAAACGPSRRGGVDLRHPRDVGATRSQPDERSRAAGSPGRCPCT